MLLLTWNLKRTERAFRLALDYLSGLNESFLATFQELPALVNSTAKATRQTLQLVGSRVCCLGVVGSSRAPGRLGLFSSSDVLSTEPITKDANTRMAMTSIDVGGRFQLRVVGLHAVDRRNVATEYARGAWAVLLRTEIEAFWKPNRPLIVMGDFNAEPYHPEVSARLGMFALRERSEVSTDWQSSLLAVPMRPLYNPMWHLLPEDSKRPAGSYFINAEDQGVRWRLCDQILVSRELIANVGGPPEILQKLGTTMLVTKHGHPSKKVSDHLPVQLRINL